MTWAAIPPALRAAVYARDGEQCRYCRASQRWQIARFHLDHVMPASRGGPTTIDNLALQCPHCSVAKLAKLWAVDPLTDERLPIFHPLRFAWPDHFVLQMDGVIVGLTPTGRATVIALRMNDALPRSARARQIADGIIEAG